MTEQSNNVSFFRFEDLRVYAKAIEYIAWVQRKVAHFPENQQIILGEKFAKAAQGIALNIANGSVRNKVQFIYYLKIARDFVRECVVYTEIVAKLAILCEEDISYSRCQSMEMTKMIGKLVSDLQNSAPTAEYEEKIDKLTY